MSVARSCPHEWVRRRSPRKSRGTCSGMTCFGVRGSGIWRGKVRESLSSHYSCPWGAFSRAGVRAFGGSGRFWTVAKRRRKQVCPRGERGWGIDWNAAGGWEFAVRGVDGAEVDSWVCTRRVMRGVRWSVRVCRRGVGQRRLQRGQTRLMGCRTIEFLRVGYAGYLKGSWDSYRVQPRGCGAAGADGIAASHWHDGNG